MVKKTKIDKIIAGEEPSTKRYISKVASSLPENVKAIVIADLFNVTEATINNYVKQNLIKRVSKNSFNLKDTVNNLVSHFTNPIVHDSLDSELIEARIKLTNEQHKKLVLENRENEKELIELTVVSSFLSRTFSILKNQILSIGSSNANELADIDNPAEIKIILDKKARSFLNQLSDTIDHEFKNEK